MAQQDGFDPETFLPYLLNRAAERASRDFQRYYKDRYGMLRTEWRVLFHLGQYGEMTAKDICLRADIHKTKVSRAVHALEAKRFLGRTTSETDRRHEILRLTRAGRAAFADLSEAAEKFDARLADGLPAEHVAILRDCLRRLIASTGDKT